MFVRLVPVLVMLLLVPGAVSDAPCFVEKADTDVDTDPFGTGVEPRFYVVRDCENCLVPRFTVFQETNGYDGLQGADAVGRPGCEPVEPDAIVF